VSQAVNFTNDFEQTVRLYNMCHAVPPDQSINQSIY